MRALNGRYSAAFVFVCGSLAVGLVIIINAATLREMPEQVVPRLDHVQRSRANVEALERVVPSDTHRSDQVASTDGVGIDEASVQLIQDPSAFIPFPVRYPSPYQAFESEARDIEWAPLAEARLYDLLGGMGAPANTVTVECRTHFCQYVVVSPGLEQLIEFQEIRNSTDFESAADLAAVGVSVDVANRRFTTTVILVQCAIVREGYPNGGSGGSGTCIY